MSLIQKFSAVEAVMQFHHSTSARPLPLEEVIARVLKLSGLRIAQQTVEEILEVYPDAYKLEQARTNWLLSTCELPLRLKERANKFATLIGARSLPSPPPTPMKPTRRIVGKAPSRVIKGTVKRYTASIPKTGDILTRIRMKEEALKRASDPLVKRQQREKFLIAQLPGISAVLHSLSTMRSSFSMSELIDRVSTSVKTRLSPSEISEAIELLSKSQPDFCSLVDSGNLKVVRLTCTAY
ncbi:Cell division cycle protein cdt1 [Wickerhamiella sorbophila]|uniref:Cell division cycle protein cdt1 n=1 Tax=Wickerhamiella sorbophila TaxID=45607 RepID=A0A2T0FJM1_9ASCO|nr:Cell division cycle protein cdt1 [Wickerhamiella sorbophila]PRT55165.1 Cell division cycle protein cdt1 [Wickerhamiella sorbophila]